jgi:hypothetical protein
MHTEVHVVKSILFLLSVFFSANALASQSVEFTSKELSAIMILLRPELNSIELHGRKAIYQPAPSIHYLGVEASETPLDLTVIADIVDLEFDHLKAKTPELRFQDGSFELRVPVEDRARAIRSRLGSISFEDVTLKAKVAWATRPDGTQELVLLRTAFEGSLKGSGILRSAFILRKTKDLCMMLLAKSMKKFLTTEKFQQSVSSGLVEYGKFYTGNEVKELEPGSIEFSANGIRYQVN